MTDRERFAATISHEPHDELLYHAGFTPDALKNISAHLGLPNDGGEVSKALGFYQPVGIGGFAGGNYVPGECPAYDPYYEEEEIPEGSYIDLNGVLHVPGSLYHFTHYVSPLRNATTLAEVEAFPFVVQPEYDQSELAASVLKAKKEDRVTMCWLGHIYENAWQVRGYQEFLIDMIGEPEICEYVLDQYFGFAKKFAIAAATAGVDYIRSGDDVANQNQLMFAPEMWRAFIKSRWADVYAAARAINPDIGIWYHSDGNITSIIPELIEIGVTILNPVQPECMDLHAIKREHGKKVVFDGTIGTQSTMPFGTLEEVRNTVLNNVRDFGSDGALIVSPTHVLEPDVSPENVVAFAEACRRK